MIATVQNEKIKNAVINLSPLAHNFCAKLTLSLSRLKKMQCHGVRFILKPAKRQLISHKFKSCLEWVSKL